MSEKVPLEPPPAYPGTAPGGAPGAAPANYGPPYPAGGQPQQYPSPQYPAQQYSQYPPPQPQPQNYPPAPGGVVSSQPVTAAHTTTQVVVVAHGNCPSCGIGYQTENFSVLGIVCAILCFPWGLICLFLCKDRKCSHCGRSFD